jgi:hypothetical protein
MITLFCIRKTKIKIRNGEILCTLYDFYRTNNGMFTILRITKSQL